MGYEIVWSSQVSGTSEDITCVAKVGTHMWAFGTNGLCLSYDFWTSTWSSIALGTTTDFYQCFCTTFGGQDYVWAQGYSEGEEFPYVGVGYYPGSGWAVGDGTSDPIFEGNASYLFDIMDDPTLYAVGDGGAIWSLDALGNYNSMSSPTVEDLYGAHGLSSADAYAVGDNGTMLRYYGVEWLISSEITTSASFQDIYVCVGSGSEEFKIIAGLGGVAYCWNPHSSESWELQTGLGTTNFYACATTGWGNWWLFGENGTILRGITTFVEDTYTINAYVSGGHGSTSPDTQEVASDETADITLTPDTYYGLDYIVDNGAILHYPDDWPTPGSYQIVNPTENHEVYVHFKRYYYLITVTDDEHCSTSGAGLVSVGGTATIIITTDDDYFVKTILDNGRVIAKTNPIILANVRKEHTLVITTTPGVWESVVVSGAV